MASDPEAGRVPPPARTGEAFDFTTVPILSLAAARARATRPRFLRELRHALLDVGFAYLSDLTSVDDRSGVEADDSIGERLVADVCAQARLFFDEDVLPLGEKERIEMKNQPSFLGWSRVSPVF